MLKKKLIGVCLLIVLTAGILNACASRTSDQDKMSSEPYEVTDSASDAGSMPAAEEALMPERDTAYGSGIQSEYNVEGEAGNTNTLPDEKSPLVTGTRKLIQRIYLTVETLEFNTFIDSIHAQVSLLGGYIENSEVSDHSYDDEFQNRYGNFTVRVPKDKVSAFVSTVDKEGNVVNRQESQEDVTLQYVDVESHKKALIIEQESLLKLMEKAEKLKDIIAIEERLSNVRYQLQYYESQLRLFDNQVNYTTITINVQEVERETLNSHTLSDRIKTGFTDSFYNIKVFITELFILVVSNWLQLLLLAVFIFVIIRIIMKKKSFQFIKRQGKKSKSDEDNIIRNNSKDENSEK